jgi:phage gp29-like protein
MSPAIPSPSVAGVTAIEKPTESDALSSIAQQLYAQMSSASLDPAMQQALSKTREAIAGLAWIIHEPKNKAQRSRNLQPDFSGS